MLPEDYLMEAAEYGKLDICRDLLDSGVDVNSSTRHGLTALHFASSRCAIDVCKLLLDRGADVNAKTDKKNFYGETVLDYATKYNYRDAKRSESEQDFARYKLCKLLIDRGAEIEITPLHNASRFGFLRVCSLLLNRGAFVNAKNNYGTTPLHNASHTCRADVCKLLLDHGANVNANDKYERTPLHYASEYGLIHVCKVLLDHGADVNAKTHSGNTPLHIASNDKYDDVCALLLDHGADIYAKDSLLKLSPYDIAKKRDFKNIIIQHMIFINKKHLLYLL
jgi:ankyrin repeat protein